MSPNICATQSTNTPDPARQVAVLRVHDVQRRGLGKPVTEHEVERAALHRLLEDEGRDLRDTQPASAAAT